MKAIIKPTIIVTLFAIAMAAVESTVVVYLRELYYPSGFTLTFVPASLKVLPIEISREFATLIMLITVGWLAGKNANTRFAWFLYAFALWDIFYYVFLKVFINWPMSLFEWDILFLIPFTWLAPVLAPVISSLTMILLAYIIIYKDYKTETFRLKTLPLTLLIIGSIFILISFTKDYSAIIIKNGFYRNIFHLFNNQEFLTITGSFIPKSFSWLIFGIGELVILMGIYLIIRINSNASLRT